MEKNINDYFDEFGQRRKERKEARKQRVTNRQSAKTNRQATRQTTRQTKAKNRQGGRIARQNVRQAKRLDKVQQRRKVSQQIDEQAANAGNQNPSNVAAGYLKTEAGQGKLKAYIQNQGAEVPEDLSTEEIAAIAQNLRDEEIQDTHEALNQDLPDGEEEYTEEEAEQFCFDSSEVDSFDGDSFDYYDPITAAAVSKAAAKGAELLKERRMKQGKSTKFIEDVEKFLKPQTAASGEPTSDIGKVIDEGVSEYKKQTIKGYIPIIIVAVVVIILTTLYFKKK